MQLSNENGREWGKVPEHTCTADTCPVGTYYVTAIDHDRVFYMAGPYNTHAEAMADVDKALAIADKHDGRAWFMSWGTCRRKDGYREPGTLNKYGLI